MLNSEVRWKQGNAVIIAKEEMEHGSKERGFGPQVVSKFGVPNLIMLAGTYTQYLIPALSVLFVLYC